MDPPSEKAAERIPRQQGGRRAGVPAFRYRPTVLQAAPSARLLRLDLQPGLTRWRIPLGASRAQGGLPGASLPTALPWPGAPGVTVARGHPLDAPEGTR